jgi:hypothetical protein
MLDRTLNGPNADYANIVEDKLSIAELSKYGKNALLFRYEDDSLRR